MSRHACWPIWFVFNIYLRAGTSNAIDKFGADILVGRKMFAIDERTSRGTCSIRFRVECLSGIHILYGVTEASSWVLQRFRQCEHTRILRWWVQIEVIFYTFSVFVLFVKWIPTNILLIIQQNIIQTHSNAHAFSGLDNQKKWSDYFWWSKFVNSLLATAC